MKGFDKMAKTKLIRVDFLPKCPYCEKELEEIGSVSTFYGVTI